MTELEALAVAYIVSREQYNNKVQDQEAPDILHVYEMDMFKQLVNLANHVKFERPEYKELMQGLGDEFLLEKPKATEVITWYPYLICFKFIDKYNKSSSRHMRIIHFNRPIREQHDLFLLDRHLTGFDEHKRGLMMTVSPLEPTTVLPEKERYIFNFEDEREKQRLRENRQIDNFG